SAAGRRIGGKSRSFPHATGIGSRGRAECSGRAGRKKCSIPWGRRSARGSRSHGRDHSQWVVGGRGTELVGSDPGARYGLPVAPLRATAEELMKTQRMTQRVTMAQALVGFLKNQYVERDGRENPLFAGTWGIFGHGNIAGMGQALQQNPDFRYYLCRNEQAAVPVPTAFAKARNRLCTFACTSSIGPGATNMITGAATATINRIPVLLLPGDIFARRNVAPVLQQLESEHSQDISVNDCLKPVSRYWDRITRPDQLLLALPEALRVLTSPSETGAVTLALPQDVQTEAYAYPMEFFQRRVWHIARNRPDRRALVEAAAWIRASRRPLIVAGGGVIYAEAT